MGNVEEEQIKGCVWGGGGGSRIASPFSAITVHVSHSSTGGCET